MSTIATDLAQKLVEKHNKRSKNRVITGSFSRYIQFCYNKKDAFFYLSWDHTNTIYYGNSQYCYNKIALENPKYVDKVYRSFKNALYRSRALEKSRKEADDLYSTLRKSTKLTHSWHEFGNLQLSSSNHGLCGPRALRDEPERCVIRFLPRFDHKIGVFITMRCRSRRSGGYGWTYKTIEKSFHGKYGNSLKSKIIKYMNKCSQLCNEIYDIHKKTAETVSNLNKQAANSIENKLEKFKNTA